MHIQRCKPRRAQGAALHTCRCVYVTHTGTHSPVRMHTAVHVHAQSMRFSPQACSKDIFGSGPTRSHMSIFRYTQGCIQTRPHRRARTRVCTPRARARSFPQGTRLPSPSAAEAGVRGMRVGQVRGARALLLPGPATTSSSLHLIPTNLVP